MVEWIGGAACVLCPVLGVAVYIIVKVRDLDRFAILVFLGELPVDRVEKDFEKRLTGGGCFPNFLAQSSGRKAKALAPCSFFRKRKKSGGYGILSFFSDESGMTTVRDVRQLPM